MISGGSTDGDSNRARKSRSMRECMEEEGARKNEVVISFGPKDLKGVSAGNSGDCTFGFAGHAVYPEGETTLPLTLGTRELKKTVKTTFTVVDAPSSYNTILGRPVMKELRAVAFTYHQKIKFSVGSQVGEVRGDQLSSQKCYVEAVRVDQKKARKEEKRVRSDEEVGWVVEEGEVHFVAEDEQEELIGISPMIAKHHLNILPRAHPIKQKKRRFGREKNKVIDVHVRDLLKAGHIREIQFPTWLSNVVLMPKSRGKWRMCVDFRDINFMPRIDQLVDSTSGYELLSFMDAYQGYHQIILAKNDQDKTNFIISGAHSAMLSCISG
ncbi:uncharacterized protein [Primulina huaijiensis]|uniref:uncharacterized protein n=1 Tax=Primulina huaijiensis TaxID=1492673 RepID=UPI003CC7379C